MDLIKRIDIFLSEYNMDSVIYRVENDFLQQSWKKGKDLFTLIEKSRKLYELVSSASGKVIKTFNKDLRTVYKIIKKLGYKEF